MRRAAHEPRRPAVALGFAAVVAVTFLVFLPSVRNGLLAWDDDGYITYNAGIGALSLDTVAWAFTAFHCNFWAPLTWLSLAVDRAIWGLDPFGFHLGNVVLHALDAGLFFLVARGLVAWRPLEAAGDRVAGERRAVATGLLAALLFAVHPLRVESVAWATERKDVLFMAFGLGAVLAYLAHARGRRSRLEGRPPPPRAPFALSLGLYALSLLAKPALVPLPVVLLILDVFPLGRVRGEGWRRLVLEKIPYLLVAAPVAVITMIASAPQTKTLAQVDLVTRVVVACRSVLRYLRLAAVPQDVSPAYLHPGNLDGLGAGDVLALAAVLGLAAAIVLTARRLPAVAAAAAVAAALLAPVSGLFQAGPQAMAARFTYAPGLAVALLAAVAVAALHARLGSSIARTAVVAGAAAAVLLLAGVTVRDIGYWRDDVTLWSRAIELNPGVSGRQYFLRAMAYQARGDWRPALEDLDRAHAIAVRKGYGAAHEIVAARARVLRDMGDVRGAAAEFDRAIGAAPVAEAREYLEERAALGP